MSRPRSLVFRSRDGLSLHLRYAPHAEEPLCLLLHGYGMHARAWDATFDRMAQHMAVAALDFRGHGDSSWDPRRGYDVPTLVDDVATVLGALGTQRVVLVGHSLGARVALHYTARFPERVERLAIVDYGPELSPRAIQHLQAAIFGEPESYASPSEYRDWLARVHGLVSPETLQAYAAHGVRKRADGRWESKVDPAFRATFWGVAGANQGTSEMERALEWSMLQRVRVPTLVVRGAMSSVFPYKVAKRMARTELTQGTLVTVDEAGHSVPIDDPAACCEAISGFLLAPDASACAVRVG